MFDFGRPMREINNIIHGAKERLTDKEFIENEIRCFLSSRRRKDMIDGVKYYKGQHDILYRKRTMIGGDGNLEEVKNLPNNRIVDNQYKKMVNQKVNYLLGQPISFKTENKAYKNALNDYFNKRFLRLIKNVGQDSLNSGIGWLFMHYDEKGDFIFKRFKPYEIIPGWRDEEHTILDYAIRIFEVNGYEGLQKKVYQKVEIYDENGITRFVLDNGKLIPDEIPHEPYFELTDSTGKTTPYNWSKIPLIPFRFNSEETPLIRNVKSLQDGLNLILSNFQNNMEEDARNTILVLVNYDGENLGEFRRNLSAYGVVKVRTIDGAAGDLRTLQVEVNAENYKTILEIFKKAIIENAMGYDAKDDRLAGNPNKMNIQSMYSDIDLDANEMETEYQASFEEVLWFINAHISNIGLGNFEGEKVEIIFNRDMMISESEVIENINNSVGILPEETLVSNHPWVDDPQRIIALKRKEQEEANMAYGGDTFKPKTGVNKNEP